MIAETLGMTVEYLRKHMTLEEVYGWNAYFSIKNEREKKGIRRCPKESSIPQGTLN